jgi:malonyl-CoA O-methyltransferase
MTTPAPDLPTLVDDAVAARWWREGARRPAPWLHGEVARRMADRLDVIRLKPQRFIDWWSGPGGSMALLRERYPQAHAIAVDAVAPDAADPGWRGILGRWLGRAAADAPHERVVTGCVDALEPVDMLWSNMGLHWQGPLEPLFARWHARLRVDGFLMFSCFGPDTLAELRALHREAGWGEPARDFVDMHDLGDALVHAGFADPVMDMQTVRLSWASVPEMLAELRTLGFNAAPGRFRGLRTPAWRRTFEAALARALTGADGRVSLGFEIVFGHAFRPAPRARVQAETTVALDDMRRMVRQRDAG